MNDNYDDLGEPGGRFEFRHGGYAKAAVKNWAISAFGRRPQDYLQRDLLFGSFERDRRNWRWRKLCKHRPPWMAEDTLGLAEAHRRQIIFQRSFHLLHQAHCLELLDSASANDKTSRVIQELRWCPPVGSRVQWNGDRRMPVRNCDRIDHCPFCFARKIATLYQQITAALPPAPGERGFLLLTATVTDGELTEAGITDSYGFVRQFLIPAMKNTVTTFGAEGGLVALQIGPNQYDSHQWNHGELTSSTDIGFEYHLGVLGEFSLTRDAIGNLKDQGSTPSLNVRGIKLQPDLSAINHQSHNSVRIALAGHMAAYNGRQRLRTGRGLFSWPSVVLANYQQWQERFDLLRNRHLYDRWGSWIGLAPASREPQLPRGSRRPTGLARSRRVLHNINNGRSRRAEDRADKLWKQHRDLILLAAARAEKPIGRSMIISSLAEQGVPITDRDSRRLAKKLKHEMQA